MLKNSIKNKWGSGESIIFLLRKIMKILYYFFLSLSVLIFLCIGSWFIAGLKPMYVVSGSMEPVFYKGDIVLLSHNSELLPQLSQGNVIAFTPDWFHEGQVTHRIIHKNDDGTIITKGDNNESSDPLSLASQVKGVLVAKVPFLGWLLNKKTLMFIAFLTFVCLLSDFLLSRLVRKKSRSLLNPFDSFVLNEKESYRHTLTSEDFLDKIMKRGFMHE